MIKYSIKNLEYANTDMAPISGQVANAHNAGFMPLTMCYQLIQGGGKNILVDCGVNYDNPENYEVCTAYAFKNAKMPPEILAKVGLSPEDIDAVIMTHGHFDHMGGLKYFPNAKFYIQKEELLGALAAMALPLKFARAKQAYLPSHIAEACNLVCEGRMVLVDGDEELFEGIRVVALPMGHSYCGEAIVVDIDENGTVVQKVLCGDAVYVKDNVLGMNGGDGIYMPYTAIGAPYDIIRQIDKIYAIAGYNIDNMVFNHDVETYSKYPSVKYDDGLYVATIVE